MLPNNGEMKGKYGGMMIIASNSRVRKGGKDRGKVKWEFGRI